MTYFGTYNNNTRQNANGWDSYEPQTNPNTNGWDSYESQNKSQTKSQTKPQIKPKPNKVVCHYHYHYNMGSPYRTDCNEYPNSHGYGCVPSHSGHYQSSTPPPSWDFKNPTPVDTTFQKPPPVEPISFQTPPPVETSPFQTPPPVEPISFQTPPPVEPISFPPPLKKTTTSTPFNIDDFLKPFSNGMGFTPPSHDPMSIEPLPDDPTYSKLELSDLEKLLVDDVNFVPKTGPSRGDNLVGEMVNHLDGTSGQIVDFYRSDNEDKIMVNWSDSLCQEYKYPTPEISLLYKDEEDVNDDDVKEDVNDDDVKEEDVNDDDVKEEEKEEEPWEDIPVCQTSEEEDTSHVICPRWEEEEEIQFLWKEHWYLGEIKSSTIDGEGDIYYDIYYWTRNTEKWKEHTQLSIPESCIRGKDGQYLKDTKIDILYSNGGWSSLGWYPGTITRDEAEDPHPDVSYDNTYYGFEYGIDPRKVRFYA